MIGPNGSSASLATSFTGDSTEDSTAPCEPPDSEQRRKSVVHRHHHQQQPSVAHSSETSTMTSPAASDSVKLPLPVQKRQRVTRACDECRRKKIKCDGKQPCTHCTVYSYLCTYDQPSNRRRNLPSQYVERLEQRLEKAEAILKVFLPDLNLDDPTLDAATLQKRLSQLKSERDGSSPSAARLDLSSVNKEEEEPQREAPTEGQETHDEGLLESMFNHSGSLDLDDEGNWDYHGQASGIIFMQQLHKFGNILPEKHPSLIQTAQESSSKAPSESPSGEEFISPVSDLPPLHITLKLCDNALDDACTAVRFMHKPSFYAMVHRIYEIPPEQYTNKEHSILPLLYLTVACGCLFGNAQVEKMGYQGAMDRAYQYYKTGRQMLDITECRDLTSLQAIIFMIIFLQSSASISTCYSYIGIALRSALRLGLHRTVKAKFNPIEQEMRKRIFWVVRKMDVHISTIMGLPAMISDDDIDQDYPLALDDEFITEDAILPVPDGYVSKMAANIAHIQLGKIMTKVTKYIYPVKTLSIGQNHTYLIRHSKIREIEGDLDEWLKSLPDLFKPGAEAPRDIERLRQLLRIGYAYVQMIMYRPFLHYVTAARQSRGIDKRSYACAAACVTVARNVVHITAGMKKKGFLNGPYWFTMYTTYFAILALLFFILENPDSTTARDGILKDAIEGKNTLAGLAKGSMAADRCAQSLNPIFKHLPEKLRNRQPASQTNRKRPGEPTTGAAGAVSTPPVTAASTARADITKSASDTNLSGIWTDFSQRSSKFNGNKISSGRKTPTHSRRSSGVQQRLPNGNGPGPTLAHHGPSNLSNSMTMSQLSADGDVSMTDASPPAVGQSSASTPQTRRRDLPQRLADRRPSPPQAQQQQQQQQQNQNQNQPHQFAFTGALDSSNYIPDLMPMMFPSDDPFAYPTQPMSTLEDCNFRNLGNLSNLSNSSNQGGLDGNSPIQVNGFIPNVFDLKHVDSMPNLGAAAVNGNTTMSSPDYITFSGDGELGMQPDPAVGPTLDELSPPTFGMNTFGYFNNLIQQFPENQTNMQNMSPASAEATAGARGGGALTAISGPEGAGAMNSTGTDSVMTNGIVTSPQDAKSNIGYNLSDPFLWARGEDGNAINNTSMSGGGGPDGNMRAGTPLHARGNSRTGSDATQQLMARMHLRSQSQHQAGSPPPPPSASSQSAIAQNHIPTTMSQSTDAAVQQQQQQQQQQKQQQEPQTQPQSQPVWETSQMPIRLAQQQSQQQNHRRRGSRTPTMNPAAASNSSISIPQTPAPTPIPTDMALNNGQQQSQQQQAAGSTTNDLQEYGMGMGMGLAYGNFSSMGLDVGDLGMPLLASQSGGGNLSQSSGSGTTGTSPAVGTSDAVVTGSSGGGGSAATATGTATSTAGGSGSSGPIARTPSSETGSVEWNQWMNVNGM